MGKRFLLVTEEWAGSGHRMAALALEEAVRSGGGGTLSAKVVGGLETASPALRELSRLFYMGMLRHAPLLWQRLYEGERLWGATLKRPLAWWLSQTLTEQLLRVEQPDVVVATHAYCLSALAMAKKKMDKPFHLVSVPTDYHINPFWVHPEIDSYIVAHQQLADVLESDFGVRSDAIHVFGIPVRPVFHEAGKRDKSYWKRQLGLSLEPFTVLISGGEGGRGGMEQVVRELAEMEEPLQIIVITGNNSALYQRLTEWASRTACQHRFVMKGYEPQIWQWIGAADAYVSKPGGISCAEALALKTPLILYQPLPGQEWKNCAFLLQHGAAVLAERPEEIRETIGRWRVREQWEHAAEQMEPLRRPESARQIAEYLLRV